MKLYWTFPKFLFADTVNLRYHLRCTPCCTIRKRNRLHGCTSGFLLVLFLFILAKPLSTRHIQADAATLAKEIAQLDEDISVKPPAKQAATETCASFKACGIEWWHEFRSFKSLQSIPHFFTVHEKGTRELICELLIAR